MVGIPQEHKLELSIEFLLELLLFLYPYGNDQMGLPHNFWLGLCCWIIAAGIAIRIFWIIPWSDRLSNLWKGTISTIVMVLSVGLFFKPVTTAYRNSAREALPNQIALNPPPSQATIHRQSSAPTPRRTNARIARKISKKGEKAPTEQPIGAMTVTQGSGSIAQIGGSYNDATIINKPPHRALTERQKLGVAEAINALPNAVGIFIETIDGNAEAYSYADQFQQILNDQGRRVKINIGMAWNPPPVGVLISAL